MNLKNKDERKGFFGTILVHVTIVLLLLLWAFAPPMDQNEDDGGVLVSFGEPDLGGAEEISSVAEEVQESKPDETSPEEPEESVITNDDDQAPEMVEQKEKVEKKEPVKEKEPEIDPEMKRRIEAMKNRKKNSDKSSNAGDGTTPGAGGDPDATNVGGAGSGKGTIGQGVSYNLKGFDIKGSGDITNNSQEFGTVVLDICVDKNGKIISITPGAGTTNLSSHLRRISESAIKNYRFIPQGEVKNTNCGNITIVYKPH